MDRCVFPVPTSHLASLDMKFSLYLPHFLLVCLYNFLYSSYAIFIPYQFRIFTHCLQFLLPIAQFSFSFLNFNYVFVIIYILKFVYLSI